MATVDAGGLATAVAVGTSTIAAALGGVTGSTTLTVRAAPVVITTASLSSGTVGVAYSATLSASGGTPPNSWSITSGSLPVGLTLNAGDGVITGAPTTAGTFSFTVQVSDASLPVQTAAKLLSITITPVLTSVTVTPADPTILSGASQQFTATGTYSDGSIQNVTSQATWTSSGSGVATISAAGLALAVSPGITSIRAVLGGVAGSTTLNVQALPLTVTTISLATGVVNVAYSAALTASGGTAPYAWSITGGTLPTGLTLDSSSGAILGTPLAAGLFSFTVQVADGSQPVQTATQFLSVTISSPPAVLTIWPDTAVPVRVDGGSTRAAELGVKFSSDVAGSVTGIRFYKASANTGTHVGNLWTSTGIRLATATFTGETASGWQQVDFAAPVAISANTMYVASYHVNSGHFSADANAFSIAGVDNPPLHALPDSVAGGNGVYRTRYSSSFPNTSGNGTNYWVDVVFKPAAVATLTSIAVTPANPTIVAGGTRQFTATGTYLDGSTQNVTSQAAWSSSKTTVATVSASGLATAVLAGSTTISATLAGVTGSTTLTVQTPLTLSSIVVTPANPTIVAGGTQVFTATGTYSDGSTQNVTSQATWASSKSSVATVSTTGVATAVSAGNTAISATLAGVTGSSTLVVQAPPIAITTTSLAAGTVGVAYSATLTASGGTTPYTWLIASGSIPPGLTLNPDSGAIAGTPTAAGALSFSAQVTDAGNPMQTATKALSITIASVPAAASIWPGTAVPGLVDGGRDSSVELGVKFRSDVAGKITGIRFYKAAANTGTHVGNLWSSAGTKLAAATFSGETASGWQQVNFSTPVAITANTVYVASYHANNGHYSADVNYFASKGVDNPPLHALANGVSGGDGVYRYGTTSAFPTQTWYSANYWVDVVFAPSNP